MFNLFNKEISALIVCFISGLIYHAKFGLDTPLTKFFFAILMLIAITLGYAMADIVIAITGLGLLFMWIFGYF